MPAASNNNGGAQRLPPRASTSDEAGLVDRRRWTSFLTWAFVLAEMAGRDGFLPTAAHAGDDDVSRGSHGTDHATPVLNNLPSVDVSTASEGPEAVTYQQAASGEPLPTPTQLSGELAEAKLASVADVLAHDGVGAGGGGSGGYGYMYGDVGHQADSASMGVVSTDLLGLHAGEEGQLVAINPAGEILDLGLNLDHTVPALLGDVADTLGHLPLAGGLLDDVGHAVAGTAGNLLSALDPVVSLVGLGGHHEAQASSFDTGLPGHLDFGSAPDAPHELSTQTGNYTNYGISLSVGTPDAVQVSGEAATHADGLGGALDSLADHLPGGDIHVSSDALHLDQSVLRIASDVLA